MNPQWLKRSLYLTEEQNCHDAFMKRWLVSDVLWVWSGGSLKTLSLDGGRAWELEQAPCVHCLDGRGSRACCVPGAAPGSGLDL